MTLQDIKKNGGARMRRLLALIVLVALVVFFLWPRAAVPASGPGIVSMLPGPEGAHAWLAARRSGLVSGAISRRVIRGNLAAVREASRTLAATGGWTDPRRGYLIYSPLVTLDLFLLDRADRMYSAALTAREAGDIPTVDELFRLGGVPLTLTNAEKYPAADRVRGALDSLALPKNVFQGYRVFLLPFAMGDVSGQGGPGYTFLAAEPRQEQLHPQPAGGNPGARVRTLLASRRHAPGDARRPESLADFTSPCGGIRWREDGRVKTADWARSPEETFAEDFRLLFGAEPAERESAATLAGDPRQDRTMAARLRRFMTNVAAGTKSGSNSAPWPEGDENTALPTRARENGWAGTLFLAGLALTGCTLRRKKEGRLPPLGR